MDCSPPGSSVHQISQARILELVAISFSWRCSQPNHWTCISGTGRWILNPRATREAPSTMVAIIKLSNLPGLFCVPYWKGLDEAPTYGQTVYKGPLAWLGLYVKIRNSKEFESKHTFPDVWIFFPRAMTHQSIKRLRGLSLEQISPCSVGDYLTLVDIRREKAGVS